MVWKSNIIRKSSRALSLVSIQFDRCGDYISIRFERNMKIFCRAWDGLPRISSAERCENPAILSVLHCSLRYYRSHLRDTLGRMELGGITKDALGPILVVSLIVFSQRMLLSSVCCSFWLCALGLLFGYWTLLQPCLRLSPFPYLLQGSRILWCGDNITQLMLIYMLFLLPHRAKFSSGELRVGYTISRFCHYLQLIVVYSTSGLLKSTGDMWRGGVAMYYLSQVQLYSLPVAYKLFSIPLIVNVQLMFPWSISWYFQWLLSHFKLPWIALGILFH